MKKGKDVLTIWKERIAAEARHGDKTAACNDADTSMTTFRTAMSRETFAALKDGELKTLEALMLRIDERKRKHEEITAQYAG